jgi:hypothetical protein
LNPRILDLEASTVPRGRLAMR